MDERRLLVHLFSPWIRKALACQLYNHYRASAGPRAQASTMAVLKNSSGPVGARLWGCTTLMITAYLTDFCRRVDFRHARHTFFQACATLWGDGADALPWGGDGADALRLGDGAETLPSICSRCVCRCAFVQWASISRSEFGKVPVHQIRSTQHEMFLHATCVCSQCDCKRDVPTHTRQKPHVYARKSFAVSHDPSQGGFCCRSVGLVRST